MTTTHIPTLDPPTHPSNVTSDDIGDLSFDHYAQDSSDLPRMSSDNATSLAYPDPVDPSPLSSPLSFSSSPRAALPLDPVTMLDLTALRDAVPIPSSPTKQATGRLAPPSSPAKWPQPLAAAGKGRGGVLGTGGEVLEPRMPHFLTPADFTFHSVLGCGAFGKVLLCETKVSVFITGVLLVLLITPPNKQTLNTILTLHTSCSTTAGTLP